MVILQMLRKMTDCDPLLDRDHQECLEAKLESRICPSGPQYNSKTKRKPPCRETSIETKRHVWRFRSCDYTRLKSLLALDGRWSLLAVVSA